MQQGPPNPHRGRQADLPWTRQLRPITVVAVLIVVPAAILSGCPANRDGMPGQLAAAKEETQSAARSAALSLQLWSENRSTRSVASV